LKRVLTVMIALAVGAAAWAASPAAFRTNAVHPGLFELGLNIGEPIGLSAKLWFDRNSAVEGIAAWDFTRLSFVFSADYLLAFPDILKIETASFPLFVGIGGVVNVGTGTAATVGLRVPLGVLFVFAKVPLEISLDVVPGLNVFPATSFLAMGGLAVRWCF
jgi:hypothetical protein